MSPGDITKAVDAGSLVRLRRGWYCVPDADPLIARAVRVGGSLSCASALVFHGVWMRHVDRLHLALPNWAHRSTPVDVVPHWRSDAQVAVVVEAPLLAFERFVTCGAALDVVIAADSLLNRRQVTSSELESVLAKTVAGRRILGRIDGRAESGTETIIRVLLRARRITVRSQVEIAGVGRVDFVVGDRLIIEVDGREWHDQEPQFEKDRARDARLVALGYLVVRFTYNRVMHDIDEVEREILALVRAGEHRWRARHRRIARNYGADGQSRSL